MEGEPAPLLTSDRRCEICSLELNVEFLPNKTSVVVVYLCARHGLVSMLNPFAS